MADVASAARQRVDGLLHARVAPEGHVALLQADEVADGGDVPRERKLDAVPLQVLRKLDERNSSEPGAARSPTAAAESAAVAAIGPVTRWRELPNAA
jgi:hypothetical protein